MSVIINRVYTRSGDKGETGLVSGKRVKKDDLRVSSFGEIDEANSFIGLLKEELGDNQKELFSVLEYLQQELFDLGSELATPSGESYEGMWRVGSEEVKNLEKLCDVFAKDLSELESFILPGGSKVAGLCHIVRSVIRRAERSIVTLQSECPKDFNIHILEYVNRLSDLFFILARYSLKVEGKDAPLWQPARERKLPIK